MLDKNQFCPCGLGKKIKFCCKHLTKWFEKILRSIEGKQFEAALQQIERACQEHPGEPGLWMLKIEVLLDQGNRAAASEAVNALLEVAPENPAAWALDATLNCTMSLEKLLEMDPATMDDAQLRAEQTRIACESVAMLHKSIEYSQSVLSDRVYHAIGEIAVLLFDLRCNLSGRRHLMLQVAIDSESAGYSGQLLAEIDQFREESPLVKQFNFMPKPVDWVTWRKEYLQAIRLASLGAWTQAAELVKSLIDTQERHPVLLQAYAELCGCLPDENRAIEALRMMADCPGVPDDDAIEALALAALIDPRKMDAEPKVERVLYSMEVTDAESVQERLLANPRAVSLPVDKEEMAGDGEPPPKAVFALLDRDLPRGAEDIAMDSVPRLMTECSLFGKRTDREARLEMVFSRERMPEVKAFLDEVVSDELNGVVEEFVLEVLPLSQERMTIRLAYPPGMSADSRERANNHLVQEQVLQIWPELPNGELDGKSPNEVVGDPAYQRRLAAAVLNLESKPEFEWVPDVFQTLRKRLQLPESSKVSVQGDQAYDTPLVRLRRVDPTELNNADLIVCFGRAARYGMAPLVLRFGQELLKRDVTESKYSRAMVYGRMGASARNLEQGAAWFVQAQAEARAEGISPARWMIMEFGHRVRLGQGQQAKALAMQVRTEHGHEPGVEAQLQRAFQLLGAAPPGGTRPLDSRPKGVAATEPMKDAPPTLPAAGVWTPDATHPSPSESATSPSDSQSGESVIWTPGMD